MKLPKRLDIQHKFRSASEVSRTSKFGWIAEAETSFTLIEFVSRYFPDRHDDPALLNHLEIMFRAAAKQPLGTPLACGYRTIGVEKRVIEPVVHRVFFHA